MTKTFYMAVRKYSVAPFLENTISDTESGAWAKLMYAMPDGMGLPSDPFAWREGAEKDYRVVSFTVDSNPPFLEA